ncbi:MAG: hydrogenase maturation protease [Deltaproteobacteria bacterium]|nr:hydrogenase maturation protease [Deltaproteobacteria bacterium]
MIGQLFDKSILIFGCGNILFGDDGFGPAVANYLKENYVLPEDVLVMDMGTSIRDTLFNLTLSEKKPQKIIIVDAVDQPGRRPGEVFEIPVEGLPEKKTADFSLHQFPTVNILQELKDCTRIDIVVLVAQTEVVPDEIKPGLTETMQAAVRKVCRRIMQCET